MCLQEEWSGILLNETHPKVLFETLFAERYRAETLSDAVTKFARRTRLKVATPVGEHEFDALISAWATREGLSGHWSDLVSNDSDLIFPAGKRVHYFWPKVGDSGQ